MDGYREALRRTSLGAGPAGGPLSLQGVPIDHSRIRVGLCCAWRRDPCGGPQTRRQLRSRQLFVTWVHQALGSALAAPWALYRWPGTRHSGCLEHQNISLCHHAPGVRPRTPPRVRGQGGTAARCAAPEGQCPGRSCLCQEPSVSGDGAPYRLVRLGVPMPPRLPVLLLRALPGTFTG